MRQKSISQKDPAEKVVRDIRRKTRRKHSTEEKIRIVLEGLRGEESIAALCRREGIAESLYYSDSTHDAQRMLWGLRGLDIVGGDVVEVSPPFDQSGSTALVGATMMFEILCLMTERIAERGRK